MARPVLLVNGTLMARRSMVVTRRRGPSARNLAPIWGLSLVGGDGNRTSTVRLGSCPIRASSLLTCGARCPRVTVGGPPATGVNVPLTSMIHAGVDLGLARWV